VLFALPRKARDDVTSALFVNKLKAHPLALGFRTLDATSYTEIALLPVERGVLDIAHEPSDSLLGLVTMDLGADMHPTCLRVYEVGSGGVKAPAAAVL
jgi:HIV-1 Vpr-binding protein